ncbi:MAG: class I SAM-dependent methyltransferase [Phycisphaeraceae bacterium]|nr:class I SAM-dependent methyltransferase [Phycisphaeraceae bacterium]
MTQTWPYILGKIKAVRTIPERLARLREHERFAQLGHYYSPDTSAADITRRADELFQPPPRDLPGIDLRTPDQLALLDLLAPLAREARFPTERDTSPTGYRYWSRNDFFSLTDALVLTALMRHHRPRRIIEIGSGFSSAVMLDVRDRFLSTPDAQPCHLTFIEPYPAERLDGLLRPADRQSSRVLVNFVQQVPLATYDELDSGDFLFIDSSHVSKIGSDVNHLFFNVLPRLKPGVLVHVHDIFNGLEYPRHWLDEGRRWNEAYLLRAFLQFNSAFHVHLFPNFLGIHEHDRFTRALGLTNPPSPTSTSTAHPERLGAGLWMRRVA